jgi:hypothetical protein
VDGLSIASRKLAEPGVIMGLQLDAVLFMWSAVCHRTSSPSRQTHRTIFGNVSHEERGELEEWQWNHGRDLSASSATALADGRQNKTMSYGS